MATTTTDVRRRFSTSLDLSTTIREAMVDVCNQQLADSFDLYSQLNQAHWNVKGRVERYADYAASTRRAIDAAMEAGDQSTADMFTEVSCQTGKDLWFLEAHLQA
jgi:DNA-binding ferritin-like protein